MGTYKQNHEKIPPVARESEIELPAEGNLGPAMRELTDPQRRFVLALIEAGDNNASGAARKAGYGGTEMSTYGAARRLMHNPLILAALDEEIGKAFRRAATIGLKVLQDIALTYGHRDQYKAADRLLERAGHMVTTKHEVVVKDDRTSKKVLEDLRLMAERAGLKLTDVLGKSQDVIDAAFVDVTPKALPAPSDECKLPDTIAQDNGTGSLPKELVEMFNE